MKEFFQYFFGKGNEVEFQNFTLAHFLPILLAAAVIGCIWYFRDKKLWIVLGTFLAIWNHNIVSLRFDLLYGRTPAVPTLWQMTQNLALLALPLIFMYNGKAGALPENRIGKKTVQLAFYGFYPIHMLVLWFLFRR